jgi:hypothetical protein
MQISCSLPPAYYLACTHVSQKPPQYPTHVLRTACRSVHLLLATACNSYNSFFPLLTASKVLIMHFFYSKQIKGKYYYSTERSNNDHVEMCTDLYTCRGSIGVAHIIAVMCHNKDGGRPIASFVYWLCRIHTEL